MCLGFFLCVCMCVYVCVCAVGHVQLYLRLPVLVGLVVCQPSSLQQPLGWIKPLVGAKSGPDLMLIVPLHASRTVLLSVYGHDPSVLHTIVQLNCLKT